MLVKPGRMMSGRERPGYGTLAARILLSAASVAENATAGTAIGTLSVENGSGSYTFTIDTDTDGKFQLDGAGLEVGAALDYETATSHDVTISADNGVDDPILRTFTITVTNVADVLPSAFVAGDWSVASGDEQASVTIANLPAAGEASISDIDYRVDGGAWTSTGGTGSFTITGLTNAVEYDIEIRAVSSVGDGPGSDTKAVTPRFGNDAFTKILLHMDGTDGATTFTDSNAGSSAHTWTAAGNAQIDTAQSKFGGASALFDGTGDWITTPDSADFTLGSGDWTCDFWFNCTAAGGTFENICGQVNSANDSTTRSFSIARSSTNVMLASLRVGGANRNVTGATQFTNAVNTGWHHLALVRTGGNVLMFIDGVQDATQTVTGSFNDSSNVFAVGQAGEVTANPWTGWVDEFRLSVGIARWTSDFTPPAKAYA